MNGRFSPDVIEAWMDGIEDKEKWLALFSTDPYASDPLAVEVIGGAYVRHNGVWTRSSIGAITLTQASVWRSLPPGAVVAAVGAFDAETNGSLLFREMLEEPITYPTGGTFTLGANDWVVGIDVPAA